MFNLKLSCASVCKSMYHDDDRIVRLHITCLWCRQRRNHTVTNPIQYGYLSMNNTVADAYKVAGDKIYHFKVRLPTILLIDPKGHFTWFRCICIMALDRLAFKFKLKNNHRVANLCEFLANYPVW